MKEPLWTPSPSRLSQATLSQFTEWLAARTACSFTDYEDLHRYSVNAPAEFWSSLWDFSQVIGEKGEPPYLADADQMPGARFFPNAQLNFAENLLGGSGADPAIVFWGEDKVKRRLSRDELGAEVARTQAALQQAGVTVMDRVAAILPNMPEGVVGVLATAALGGGVVILFARFRRSGRARSLRSDRAEGPDRLRWLLLQRQVHRHRRQARSDRQPAADAARGSSWFPISVAPRRWCRRLNASLVHKGPARRPGRMRSARGRVGAAIRAPAFRASPVHDVLVRHDGHAQMHRAFRRRRAAQTFSEHRLHCRPARGRQVVLFHDAGLDDVELVGLRSRIGRNPAALRWLAFPSRRQHPVGLRAGGEGDPFRHVRQIHRRPEEGRTGTGQDARSQRHARRCFRPARRWRRKASTTSTRASSTTCIWPRSPVAPISAAASCWAFPPSRYGAGRSRVRRLAWPSTCSMTDGKPASCTTRASSSAPSRSPPCRSGSGTMPTARNIDAAYFARFPTSGITATSPNGPSTAA